MSKTKADLLEEIKVAEYNINGLKQTIEIQRIRLEQMWKHLESLGYSKEKIRKIVKLDCENI